MIKLPGFGKARDASKTRARSKAIYAIKTIRRCLRDGETRNGTKGELEIDIWNRPHLMNLEGDLRLIRMVGKFLYAHGWKMHIDRDFTTLTLTSVEV